MALSAEERARRQGNAAGERPGDRTSHYLDNYHKDNKPGSVDLILHTGEKVREFSRHGYQVPVVLPAKEDKPERKILIFASFRCWHPESWWINYRRDKPQSIGHYSGKLECPMCRFAAWAVREHPDDVVLALGRGCTTSDGNPVPVMECTGRDLAGLTEGASAYKRSVMARGVAGMIVVPYRFQVGDVLDPECKIAIPSWGVWSAFKDEIEVAKRDFGEDEASPAVAPAIYRWGFHPDKVGQAKNSVRYLNHEKAPEAHAQAWEGAIPDEVLVEFRDSALAYGNAEQAVEDLSASLRVDADLRAIMLGGKPPSAGRIADTRAARRQKKDEDATEFPPKDAAPAANPAPQGSRRGAPPPKKDERPGEPCGNCGTHWPTGERFCPGRERGVCNWFDETVPEAAQPTAQPAAESDALPWDGR